MVFALSFLIISCLQVLSSKFIKSNYCCFSIYSFHAFFYQIMYDPTISSRILSWVNQHSTVLAVWLSLGYINTYLVDLFYIKEKYTQYELLQYRINVTSSTIAMFPILNIVIYHSIIKKMRKNAQLLSTKGLIILYLKGQLITYLIRVKQKEIN